MNFLGQWHDRAHGTPRPPHHLESLLVQCGQRELRRGGVLRAEELGELGNLSRLLLLLTLGVSRLRLGLDEVEPRDNAVDLTLPLLLRSVSSRARVNSASDDDVAHPHELNVWQAIDELKPQGDQQRKAEIRAD